MKSTKSSYDHHFEKIEVSCPASERRAHRLSRSQQEEFENQRKLHANIEQVVADLAESRREYDHLQVEYEKVLIANQQSGEKSASSLFSFESCPSSVPITREMRSLINHLQAQCKLYSLEASRCKKQCKDLEDELTKLKVKQEAIVSNGLNPQISIATSEPTSAGSTIVTNQPQSPTIKEEPTNPFAISSSTVVKSEPMAKEEPIEGVRIPILVFEKKRSLVTWSFSVIWTRSPLRESSLFERHT